MLVFLFVLSLSVCVVQCGGDSSAATPSAAVLKLDSSNFDSEVGGDLPTLVEFYAPWCGHCKNLAPEYDIVASSFIGQSVKIAAVDADTHRDLAEKFEVEGFPTIKFFPSGSSIGEEYSGGRTSADIIDFINKKIGTSVKAKVPPTAVMALDPSNFDAIVKDTSKDVLVEFYAPWCGHCKKLSPIYEKVALSFDGEEGIVIAKVDADAHKDLASAYDVSGYPTLKWFPKSNKDGESYDGGRSAEEFIDFINRRSGTFRTVGGGYTEEAGRIPFLLGYVESFNSANDAESKTSVLHQVEELVQSNEEITKSPNAEFAKFYILFMKKSINEEDFVANEVARLNRMLAAPNVNSKNKAQFAKRINIAKLFKR